MPVSDGVDVRGTHSSVLRGAAVNILISCPQGLSFKPQAPGCSLSLRDQYGQSFASISLAQKGEKN